MPSRPLSAALVGLIAGLLFSLHSLLPHSYLYPLIWPLLAGGLAVYIASRRTGALTEKARQVVLAAGTGAVAAVAFLFVSITTIYAFSAMASLPRGPALAANQTAHITPSMVVNVVIVALFFVPVAAIGGILARPILRIGRT